MNKGDKKLFYDLYEDGSKDYYYMTFEELEQTFGTNGAHAIWEKGWTPEVRKQIGYYFDEEEMPYDNDINQIISSYSFDE